jgi:hypothetical protein
MRLAYTNPVEEELLSALIRAKVAFAVVGGHAVLCYSPPERPDGSLRTLGDLDVLVSADASNLERLSQALATVRIWLTAEQLREAFATGKLPNLVMYRAQVFPSILGVQTAGVLANRVFAESSVGPVPVIALSDLVLAKKAAARPKDLEDVLALERSDKGQGTSAA